jgi:outer membrane protein assembly factor BamB
MRALILALLAAWTLPAPAAESWPSFRRTPDLAGSVDLIVADAPKLLWTFDARTGVQATAAIAGGRAHVGTLEAGLLCLDLLTAQKEGKELWRAKTEGALLSSPAVASGRVIAGDDLGVLYAFDAATGAEAWRFDTRKQEDGGGEIVSSVTISGELALFGSYDSHLYAVRQKDGSLAWKYQTQAQVRSTPAVVDGLTFVAGCDAHVRAVEVATGKEAWALEIGDNCPGSPGIGGDRLVVGTLGQQVLCLDWKQR